MPNTLIHTEPKIEPGRDRSLDLVWEVSKTDDGAGTVDRELAVLSIYHTGRRSFSASLGRHSEHKDPSSPFKSRSCMPFDAIPVLRQPCERYSAKALATFGAQARAALVAMADEPKVAAVFAAAVEPPTCILSDDDIVAGRDDDCTTHDHEAAPACRVSSTCPASTRRWPPSRAGSSPCTAATTGGPAASPAGGGTRTTTSPPPTRRPRRRPEPTPTTASTTP
jgi:hypothetical protein